MKNLHGDMRLFKNENYTDFYTEPPVLSLEDVLYVEVNMERPLVSDIDSSSNVSPTNISLLYVYFVEHTIFSIHFGKSFSCLI